MKNYAGLILAAAFLISAPASAQKDPGVLITVDGVPIKKADAVDRTWKQYGTAVLNDMADEIIIKKAAADLKVKPDGREVESRLKRIQGQFPDEATFKSRLAANGTSLAELRARIEDQVLRENLVAKAKVIEVTDKDVKDFFDTNKDKLGNAESARLRTILVSNEKEAADFLTALKAGADFAKLASQVSLDANTKDRGGDLGFISRGMLLPEIEKVAFAMKPGSVSEPIKTQAGFIILKVEEFKAPKAAVFKDIKDDLRKAIIADKINKAMPGYLQELREKAKIEAAKS